MAAPDHVVVDEHGFAHSVCLHWEGFPAILWDLLRTVGYTTPPHYVGYEFEEHGVPRCRVQLTLWSHPMYPEWPSLDTETEGFRLGDTWETADYLNKNFPGFLSRHNGPKIASSHTQQCSPRSRRSSSARFCVS